MSTPPTKFLLTLVPLVLLVAATAYLLQQNRAVEFAVLFPDARELPEFSLTDQDGAAFTAAQFAGQWDLVFFGFTHCPDICPLTLQLLATARTQMQDQGIEQLPRIVLVSVDPERDTPALLQKYTTHFGAGVIGLTGEPDQLVTLTQAVGIYFRRDAGDENAENYNVSHGAQVIIIDPAGRNAGLFSPPHSVDAFAHDMPILMQQ